MRKLALTAMLIFGIALVIQYSTLDGIEGLVLPLVMTEDTMYSRGYTDKGFRSIRTGMTDSEVSRSVGAPIGETWYYTVNGTTQCIAYLRADKLVSHLDRSGCHRQIADGMTKQDLWALEKPQQVWWRYSRSPSDTNYRLREILFVNSRVASIRSGWYYD